MALRCTTMPFQSGNLQKTRKVLKCHAQSLAIVCASLFHMLLENSKECAVCVCIQKKNNFIILYANAIFKFIFRKHIVFQEANAHHVFIIAEPAYAQHNIRFSRKNQQSTHSMNKQVVALPLHVCRTQQQHLYRDIEHLSV